MSLLHWTTLEPQKASNVAAIRFSVPVIITRVRVFGPGERLFEQDETLVSNTELPESHQEVVVPIRLFLTAASPAIDLERPKPSNQLESTRIYFDGGTQDFEIDLKQHSTRLLVFDTWIPRLTVAIYGQPASDGLTATEPPVAPGFASRSHLPVYLNISQHSKPLDLAASLCTECVGDVTPLHLLRLMFLLKPSDEDWELPGYPARYADLSSLPELDLSNDSDGVHPKQRWLEQIMEELRFPVHDEEPESSLLFLSEALSTALETPSVIKPAWLIHVLNNLNKHPPQVSRVALDKVDLGSLLQFSVKRDNSLLEKCYTCASNPSFAAHLCKPRTIQALQSIKDDKNPKLNQVIDSLVHRAEGWITLQDALTNESTDFGQCISWIYDILGEEDSFSMLLQGLVAYTPIANLLGLSDETVVKPAFTNRTIHCTLPERRAFLRAIVGVGTVIPVFCWANSEGKHLALQRIIHSFLLWQVEPGYADILDRMLSLKQCLWRLSMTVRDCTQGTSLAAERVIYRLYRSNPHILFKPTFLQHLSDHDANSIPFSDDVWFTKATRISQSGLSGVLSTLLMPPFLLQGIEEENAAYYLRVLVEYLNMELHANGMDEILRALLSLDAENHGLVDALASQLAAVSTLIGRQTGSSPTSGLTDDLLRAATSILDIIPEIGQITPPLCRVVDKISQTSLQLSIACESIVRSEPQSAKKCRSDAVQGVQTGLRTLLSLFSRDMFGELPSARLFEGLLLAAQIPFSFDPGAEIRHASLLLEALLPDDQIGESPAVTAVWRNRVVTQLPLMRSFLSRGSAELRARWISRLMRLDDGELGIAEYLLEEEISQLQIALERLQVAEQHTALELALQFQVADCFEVLDTLLRLNSGIMRQTTFSGRLAARLASCYAKLSQLRLHDTCSADLARQFLADGQQNLKIAAICTLLRQMRLHDESSLPDVLSTLRSGGPYIQADIELLCYEIGSTLLLLSTRAVLPSTDVAKIIGLLEWLTSHTRGVMLQCLTYEAFQSLQRLIEKSAGSANSHLSAMANELHFAEDSAMDDSSQEITAIAKLGLTISQMKALLDVQNQPRTPPKSATHPALGLVTTSPPTINRSPMSNTLNKVYASNDFRQLRTSALGRLNTSRPPSIHVDDFISSTSPLGSRSVTSHPSAQSSPAVTHAPPNTFIPGL